MTKNINGSLKKKRKKGELKTKARTGQNKRIQQTRKCDHARGEKNVKRQQWTRNPPKGTQKIRSKKKMETEGEKNKNNDVGQYWLGDLLLR